MEGIRTIEGNQSEWREVEGFRARGGKWREEDQVEVSGGSQSEWRRVEGVREVKGSDKWARKRHSVSNRTDSRHGSDTTLGARRQISRMHAPVSAMADVHIHTHTNIPTQLFNYIYIFNVYPHTCIYALYLCTYA